MTRQAELRNIVKKFGHFRAVDAKRGGLYAVGYCRGDAGLIKSQARYNRVLDFIEKNGLEVDGDCDEEYPLNEISTPDPADYLVKIAVKCRLKNSGPG